MPPLSRRIHCASQELLFLAGTGQEKVKSVEYVEDNNLLLF